MTRFTGSNTERQSVGLPGHCETCASVGHVAAHPDLGCGDVGCYSAHDEPAPQQEATPEVPDVSIPATVLVWDALVPNGAPSVFTDGNRFGTTTTRVPVHFFYAIRDDNEYGSAPVGILYTATGAHLLDDIFATMWNHPDAVALRDLARDGRNVDPGLSLQERARETFTRLWAEFRASR